MRLLVLGGTKFLGRHIIAAALARDHEVTIFTRGRLTPDLPPQVEWLRGDRDGDLGALAGRRWEAVIDTSGYVPRIARASAEALRGGGRALRLHLHDLRLPRVQPGRDRRARAGRHAG